VESISLPQANRPYVRPSKKGHADETEACVRFRLGASFPTQTLADPLDSQLDGRGRGKRIDAGCCGNDRA
jgi:hypothetical protein